MSCPSVGTGRPRARKISSATRPGPAGLVARPETGAVVAVEVLVEEHVVLPRRVLLQALDPAEARPAPVLADEEERDQAPAQVVDDLAERVLRAGTGGVLHLQLVAEEARVADERLDDEEVDGHPHRPAPVRVPTEHAGRRLGRLVVDRGVHAGDVEDERVLGELPRDGAQAVRREELAPRRTAATGGAAPAGRRRRRGAPAGRSARRQPDARQRRRSAARLLTVSARSTISSSIAATPSNGSTPTIERTLSACSLPSGRRSRS